MTIIVGGGNIITGAPITQTGRLNQKLKSNRRRTHKKLFPLVDAYRKKKCQPQTSPKSDANDCTVDEGKLHPRIATPVEERKSTGSMGAVAGHMQALSCSTGKHKT